MVPRLSLRSNLGLELANAFGVNASMVVLRRYASMVVLRR